VAATIFAAGGGLAGWLYSSGQIVPAAIVGALAAIGSGLGFLALKP